jgi:acyl-lipid omega-6 desaturase (Delta-12 desaturase)
MTLTLSPPTDTDAPVEPGSKAPANGSLKPVIDLVPDEAYENPTWKGLAYFGRDLLVYGLIVWGLIVVSNPFATLALLVLAALAVTALFVVAHDSAHGALFSSKRMNSVIGHIAMLPSWHVYEAWILGHNRIHHAYTVRQGYDFVWQPYTADEYAAMSPLGRLRHRFEWSWAGAGSYYIREVWLTKMMVFDPPSRWKRAISRDRAIVYAYLATFATFLAVIGWSRTGTILGTAWLIVKVMVIPFLAFSYLIGSVVHVHHVQPDIRWWKRREWTKFKGQMEGTTILRTAPGMNFFLHWIMIHIPHHVDMRIPMYNLELAADAIKAGYPDTVHDEPMRFRDFIANSRQCKLYDYDNGTWMTYPEAAAHLAANPVEPEPAAA